jgi:hypothetical protein
MSKIQVHCGKNVVMELDWTVNSMEKSIYEINFNLYYLKTNLIKPSKLIESELTDEEVK